MSADNLRSEITEDYLTCPICCNEFHKPKALPCLHTFCESCLRDYVVSRGYGTLSSFPCPVCRKDCNIPAEGVDGFPTNHVMTSLLDTISRSKTAPHNPGTNINIDSFVSNSNGDNEVKSDLAPVSQSSRSTPVPKPRTSLGAAALPPLENSSSAAMDPEPQCCQEDKKICKNDFVKMPMHRPVFEVDEGTSVDSNDDNFEEIPDPRPPQVDDSPPPPYSSVADSRLSSTYKNNDTDWMFVPRSNPNPNPYLANPHLQSTAQPSVSQQGWNVPGASTFPLPPINNTAHFPTSFNNNPSYNHSNLPSAASLYPTVPPMSSHDTACTKNMLLQFGKQGATARDFMKPNGLAVTADGFFIISDNGGSQNRIMVFNPQGVIQAAFKTGGKVNDIAITCSDEIIASIENHPGAFRTFTKKGQLKGEFCKGFTFEKPGGIAELKDGGIVFTGIDNHCVNIFTPQLKFSTKFGRKGNGDGYFLHPGFVAVDSKNQIIVTDQTNSCVQVFKSDGRFKHRFGSLGSSQGQLHEPMGVCVDSSDNIIVADSGNNRVEVFSPSGRWISSVVRDTFLLGEEVKPVNVAMTPVGKVAVLLTGRYFAEVRVFESFHQQIMAETHATVSSHSSNSVWYGIPSLNQVLDGISNIL